MSEIKLKAKRKNTDDWLMFNLSDLFHSAETGLYQVCVEDAGLFAIDPDTIRLADDPRNITAIKLLKQAVDAFEEEHADEEEVLICSKWYAESKFVMSHTNFDPRKAMLDELRLEINKLREYKSFVRVEGDPVPTLPQIEKWCVIWILDEMEAKL